MYNSNLSASAMMPLHIIGSMFIDGVFRFTNNFSVSKGIQIGTRYRFEFPSNCQYVFYIETDSGLFVEMERGRFAYMLDGEASRIYNSGGGYSRIAMFDFFPNNNMANWDSLWTATDQFSGSFQSMYGIADFNISK